MVTTFVEFCEDGVVVYAPGTTAVAASFSTLDEALVYARAGFPENEVRIITSISVKAMLGPIPSGRITRL